MCVCVCSFVRLCSFVFVFTLLYCEMSLVMLIRTMEMKKSSYINLMKLGLSNMFEQRDENQFEKGEISVI